MENMSMVLSVWGEQLGGSASFPSVSASERD